MANAAPKKSAAPKKAGAKKQMPAPKKSSVKKVAKGDKGGESKKKNQGKVTGVVDEDYEIDGMERFTGECVYYNRTSGFGFVELAKKGVVPEDKVMVYWKEIQSDDRWPFLHKGMAVEFNCEKVKRQGNWQVRASNVSGLGGEMISLQDEIDEKREFVGEKSLRFLGNVKFYDFNQGFGYVRLQDGYDIDESVPEEFRIDRAEITAGDDGACPRLKPGMEIEFGIFKTTKGKHACYHVTLPGGDAITRAFVEGRENQTDQTFKGEVSMWSGRSGFGWINPDNFESFPKAIKEAYEKDQAKRKEKAKKNGDKITGGIYARNGDKAVQGERLSKGDKVEFNLYSDSQGVGACNIKKI